MIGQLFHTQYSMAHMQIKSQTFSKIAEKNIYKETENHKEKRDIKRGQQFAFFFNVGFLHVPKMKEKNIKCD